MLYLALPETFVDQRGGVAEFSAAGRATAAVAAWMALWWMTEAVHVSVTALLPIALFPLVRARSITEATASYGHPLIFLFLGGFVLALAMQRWGLHRRIALNILRIVGTKPRFLMGGFMFATAGLSMWLSNTATTAMMLPIAISVAALTSRGMGGALMLGIAYAASIGGIGTIIGTPPNALLIAYLQDHVGREIGFLEWMTVGIPVVVVMLPLTWWLLCLVALPKGAGRLQGSDRVVAREHAKLGRMSRGESLALVVFLLTAAAWVTRKYVLTEIEIGGFRPLGGLTDHGIAIIAAVTLFVLPVNISRREFVMDWATARHLPWDTLLLFGGGLSLAAAIAANGVGDLIGAQVAGLAAVPGWVLVLIVVAIMIFLTELTSNMATTATMIPILAGVAVGIGMDPVVLIVPATIAASCAFMLPVATPPNAIVFGSGYVTIPQMVRAGFWLNLAGIVVITLLTYAVIVPLLGSN